MSNDTRSVVVEVFEQIVPEARSEEIAVSEAFRDQFEIDSLDFLNFVLALEARFDLHVPETDSSARKLERRRHLPGRVDRSGEREET